MPLTILPISQLLPVDRAAASTLQQALQSKGVDCVGFTVKPANFDGNPGYYLSIESDSPTMDAARVTGTMSNMRLQIAKVVGEDAKNTRNIPIIAAGKNVVGVFLQDTQASKIMNQCHDYFKAESHQGRGGSPRR